MRTGILRLAATTLSIIAALHTAPCAAAEAPPIAARSAAGIDASWWVGGQTFVFTPFFHDEIVRGLFVDFDLAFAPENVLRQSGFAFGNPTLGLHYASHRPRNVLTWFLGARIGLPLATAGNASSDVAGLYAARATAYYDPYRFTVDHLPFVWLLGFEWHPVRALSIRLPIEPMLFVPTSTEFALHGGVQARFEIEGHGQNGVGGGLAMQGVVGNLFPSSSFRTDRAQFSMEPFFSFDNGTLIARAGVLVALDNPITPLGVVTPHLQLGAHLR